MKILSVRHLDGPNIYIYKPILLARVDLEELAERESYEVTGFTDWLLQEFPGLREHHCAKGEPGGFVERLYGGTYFGHIVEHLTIEMSCMAGLDVHYGKTLFADYIGIYDIVMECKEYEAQKFLLEKAIQIVESFMSGKPVEIQRILDDAVRVIGRTALGPSTRSIVEAALKRDIPVRRLNRGSLIQLGYGCNRKLVQATMTENTSAVGVDIAGDKSLANQLLAQAGIPVPEGKLASSANEAVEEFHRLGGPVVIKPYNGNQGKGVSLNLQSEAEVRAAFAIAVEHAPTVLVERYISGKNIRLLVVNGKFVAASERLPAHVVGDGSHTIRELIDQENRNPLRGHGHEKPLTKIPIDAVVNQTLQRQNITFSHIPNLGEIVILRDSANLSTGGVAVDITHQLHPQYCLYAERAARVVGLDVCGIDMIVPDATQSCDPLQCAIIEINASPGIRMHHFPTSGQARGVGEAIVESLYPNGALSRIPVVTVTGTNGKTTTTRLIGHGVAKLGKTVGMTTTGGIFIGGQEVVSGDTTGPNSARIVLSDPDVEVAILETARGGIVRGGLAYDKASVAVLTNITLDHVGQDGADSIEDLIHIKSLVAECVHDDGVVVLNADDDHLVHLARRLSSKVVFFSKSHDNPALRRHLAVGGVGYYVSENCLMEARGNLSWEVVRVLDVPLTMGGQAKFHVENCLAATGALRALGLSRSQVAESLTSFKPDKHNPGRCMLYQMPGGGRVVLDYGHNPDGFSRIGEWLREVPHRRLIGVVGVPGDRADYVIQQSSSRLAAIFDAFIVKEDEDKRGRAPGEVADLIFHEIASASGSTPCKIVLSEPESLRTAISEMEPGDITVMFYEHLEPNLRVVEELGGKPLTTLEMDESESSPMQNRVLASL